MPARSWTMWCPNSLRSRRPSIRSWKRQLRERKLFLWLFCQRLSAAWRTTCTTIAANGNTPLTKSSWRALLWAKRQKRWISSRKIKRARTKTNGSHSSWLSLTPRSNSWLCSCMTITTYNSSLKTSQKCKKVSVSKRNSLFCLTWCMFYFSGEDDAVGNGLMNAGEFLSAHSDVNVRNPLAVAKLAY